MQIVIKTSGTVTLTDELRAFVDEKAGKLAPRIDPHDAAALMEIDLGSAMGGQRTGDVYRAEINLSYKNGFLRAEASCPRVHEALDQALNELKRELKKSFGQRRDIFRRGAAQAKGFIQRLGGRS